ncbi:MAG TPA: protein translocase subunit SecF [Clostridiales bacterium]|nr:protein translocase subunit SecF [Clostridiales bacterium]
MKIVSKAKVWIAIPLCIIVIGLIFGIINNGFNLGIDFKGGTLIHLNIGQPYDVGDIRSILNQHGLDEAVVSGAGDGNTEVLIRMPNIPDEDRVSSAVIDDISKQFQLAEKDILSVEKVGSVMSKELTQNALLAVVLSCGFMLVYIWIRFEFKSGVAAIIALVHDVLIIAAFLLIFRIQINSTFIAAVLTIIGYSINNTIVIFDRIRENTKKLRKCTIQELTDKSIKQSVVRSINTSLTTLIVIVVLYILGVESIKEFALPIIIGIIAGTYSSLLIAGPIWAVWTERSRTKKLAPHRK